MQAAMSEQRVVEWLSQTQRQPLPTPLPMSDQISKVSTTIKCPVFSCPTEILISIFEAAVQENQEGFAFATSLSHVCRRFRSVAVDAPTLWTSIECGMRKKNSAIQAFWCRMSERNKGQPVVIVIYDIHLEDSWPLSYCSLDKFPNIKELTFSFPLPYLVDEFEDPNFAVPTGRIDKLRLVFPENPSSGPYKWEAFLGRFPYVKSLYFYNAPMLRVEIDVDDSAKLHSGASISQIEELEIARTELLIPGRLQLSRLQRLKLSGPSWSYWWLDQISCPKLTVLDLTGDTDISCSMLFLAEHSSITSLHLLSWEGLKEIVKIAPQLQHLAFGGQGIQEHYHLLLDSKPGAKLPVLRSLSTWDMEGTLRLHHFDEIVRGRCLPSGHPLSLLPPSLKPLESLTICCPPTYSYDMQLWRDSELFHEAKYRVERYNEGNDLPHVQFILSWI